MDRGQSSGKALSFAFRWLRQETDLTPRLLISPQVRFPPQTHIHNCCVLMGGWPCLRQSLDKLSTHHTSLLPDFQ